MEKKKKDIDVDASGEGIHDIPVGSVGAELDRIIERVRKENEALRNVLDNIKTAKK